MITTSITPVTCFHAAAFVRLFQESFKFNIPSIATSSL